MSGNVRSIKSNKRYLRPRVLASFAAAMVVVGMALTFSSHAADTQSVYYGAYVGDSSPTLTNLTAFETAANKKAAIVNNFYSWSKGGTFPSSFASAVRTHGSIPLITWEPWDSDNGSATQPTYKLSNIINGSFDTYIRQWAIDAKAWNHPFFLRFAHEGNGNWYPWAEQANGNSAGQYSAAWKHVHDIFASVGATNATWVWCINKEYTGSTPLLGLYPGDNYVDWAAVDAYNRGTVNGNVWKTFTTLVDPTYNTLLTVAPSKPFMVAETGTVEEGGSKPTWFTDAFATNMKTKYPRFKALLYFNENKIYNNKIDTTEASRASFANAIGSSYYSSNVYSTFDISPIPPMISDATTTDILAPFVYYTKPTTNTIVAGSRAEISVNAIDKNGIAKIDVYVNNVLKCTEKLLPYQCFWDVPAGSATYVYMTKTYDPTGNMATAKMTVTAK